MVIVMPGHTESVTGAAGWLLNKAGVTIMAMGQEPAPVVTLTTAAAASINITAANNVLSGITIDATGVDAITAAVNVQAANFRYLNNRMISATATGQATLGILTTAAADRLLIANCRFEGTTDAGTASIIRIVGGDQGVIRDCYISGAYTTSLGVENVTTACTNFFFLNNMVANLTASSTVCLTMVATSTGGFANNRFSILSGTAPVVFAAGTNWGGNYYKAAPGVAAATLL
jgi:hypothetical protein